MWLFIALLMVPIIEITLFITVGGAIGLWPTLAIVILTAVAGSYLIRRQGIGALMALRTSVGTLRDPTRPLFDGAAVIFSGALLLTPGFLTDTLGLLLLLPPVRDLLYDRIRRRITVVASGYTADIRPQPGDVVEGEFTEVPPEELPRRGHER